MTEGIFDNISPNDFLYPSDPQHLPHGKGLELFFETGIIGASMAYSSMGGKLPFPTIALSDGTSVWHLASPGGNLDAVLSWIHAQMEKYGATMYFFAMRTEMARGLTGDEIHDAANEDDIAAGMEQDAFDECIFFYAGQKASRGFAHHQATAKVIGQDLGPVITNSDQPNILFDSILL